MDMLRPDVILGSILYAVIGVVVLWVSFVVIDKPGSAVVRPAPDAIVREVLAQCCAR